MTLSWILAYFGEDVFGDCGNCDNCIQEPMDV